MTFAQFLAVVEIRTKVISLSTYALATLYLIAHGVSVAPLDAALLLVAVLAVDMGTTSFNSFYDYVRGVDHPLFTMEPDKVLLHQGVAPGHAFLVSAGLYAVAATAGVVLAARSTWWIIPVGVACMMVGFFYTGGRRPISRTPFGEVFAGGFLGSVLFLVIVVVHAGSMDVRAVVASLPSTLVIASVLAVNNACDLDGDRAAGRRTLAIVLGRAGGQAVVWILVTAALLLVAWVPLTALVPALGGPWLPRLPAIGLAPAGAALAAALATLAAMRRRGYSHATKFLQMRSVIRIVLVYTAAYAAAFGLAILADAAPSL